MSGVCALAALAGLVPAGPWGAVGERGRYEKAHDARNGAHDGEGDA